MPLGPFIGNNGAPVPFNPPTKVGTFDAANCFTGSLTPQTFTASGYFQESGAPATLDVGPGLFDGYWIIDWTARKQTAGTEEYTVYLLGSNDPAFAPGNTEMLAVQDFGGARSAVAPSFNTCGASPAVTSGETNYIPVLNFKSGIVYRYIRAGIDVNGTAPTATVNSWLTYDAG
jgi:hypothetical protein